MELQEDGTYQQTGDPNQYTNLRPFEIGRVGDDPRVVEQARQAARAKAPYRNQAGNPKPLTAEQQAAYQADINQQAMASNKQSLAAGEKPVWKVDKDGNYYLVADPNKEDSSQYSTNDNSRG